MSHTPETAYETVLAELDADALAPRVRAAVGSDTVGSDAVAVGDWSVDRLGGGVSELSGNAHFRLSGTARDAGECVPWSLVVKVHDLGDGETVTDRESDREIGFYRSGLGTDGISGGHAAGGSGDCDGPGDCDGSGDRGGFADRGTLGERGGFRDVDGFRPVRCLDVEAVDEPASVWLWLEDLGDAFDGDWPLAQFERTARHLGRFNGAFVGDVPTGEWFRPYEFGHGRAAPVVAALERLPDHPGLERGLPPAVRDPLGRVWDVRHRLLERQASLTQTFCHFDPTPGNLFARETADGWETVAIDWEFCGRGPLGADAALLVAASPVAQHADVGMLPDLDDVVFDAYLDGLRDAGWRGDRDRVRTGYVSTMVAHWLESIGTLRRPYLDPETGEAFEHLFGVSRDTWLTTMGERARFLADRAEDAVDLLDGPVE